MKEESKLIALKPLLCVLADDSIVIETDLTVEEITVVAQGVAAYKNNPETFIPLSSIL